jgi:hypothetical protein
MSKIDPLLKTLQVRPSPPEALVQAYLIHIADKSDTNFRKILDLKGVRRADQSTLMDLFNAFKASPTHANLAQNSPFLTPLQLHSVGTGIGSLGNAAGAMGTPGRFDPAGLGNAMVSAVREGVDRSFGGVVPAAGEGGAGGTASPQTEQKANLNENLKNIGKFFRRDVGGFRGFGRSEEAK